MNIIYELKMIGDMRAAAVTYSHLDREFNIE